MKLIVITTPTFFEGEAEALNLLLEASVDRIHIRKPDSERHTFEVLIQAIRPEYLDRITIHDHHAIAVEKGLGGIHLNRRNPVAPAGFNGLVSRSCHSLEELALHKQTSDYLFLSPIFDSLSKVGYESQFSLDTLDKASRQGIIDEKVIALGGLSRQTIPAIRTIPFGGYALLGAIWGKTPETLSKDELLRRYKSIQDETRDNIS